MGEEKEKDIYDLIKASNLSNLKNSVKRNEEFGITQEYNKDNRNKLWDSTKGKREFKKSTFKERKMYDDPISGRRLHSTQNAAQKKYNKASGSKKWARYSPETDHIVSLKEIHTRIKKNPYLSDKDMKEIANIKQNYRITSKSYNTSKGEKSDFESVFDLDNEMSFEGRETLVKGKFIAEASLATSITGRTVKNITKEFSDGAVNGIKSSSVFLIANGVKEMCLVASGEKCLDDSVKGMAKTTIEVAATGGMMKVIATGLKGASKSVSSGVLGVITVSMMVKDSFIRYINGEIDEKGLADEIMISGVATIGASIGAFAGSVLPIPVVSQAICSMIVSTACVETYKACKMIKGVIKSLDYYKSKESKINRIASEALYEITRQQNILKDMITDEFTEWDKQFGIGIQEIYNSTIENDVEGIAKGLNTILSTFKENVKFETVQEFDEFFMDENNILTL